MTLFEYLTVGYSLIVSFAVLRALSGLPYILRTTSRYWVHVAWVFLGLFGCLFVFWAFWRFREAEWTLPRYIIVLAVPALLYVHNSILVPSDPASVTSWRAHFFEVRVPLFMTACLMYTAAIIANYLLLDVSLSGMLTSWGLLGLSAAALASANPRLHALLALGPLLFAAAALTLLARPDF